MNFSLHYSINYLKNENCLPSILNLFSVIASFSKRFPGKCSRSRANAGYYKKEFEFSFHSRKYWSRVTRIDCKFDEKLVLYKMRNSSTNKNPNLAEGIFTKH